MTTKPKRCIRSKVVLSMLSLSHFAFKEKLLFNATCLESTIQIVNESYTTKTCGRCGQLKDRGGLKDYDYPSCRFKIDRGLNAARNVFLKYE